MSLPGLVVAQDPAGAPRAVDELASVPYGPDTSVQYVAVVDRGVGLVDVYLCDGADVAVWLEGSGDVTTGGFAATGADGTAVRGTIADGTATGTVALADGTTGGFAVPAAVLPAGLYERVAVEDGVGVRARTTVLANGTAKGKRPVYTCALGEAAYESVNDSRMHPGACRSPTTRPRLAD